MEMKTKIIAIITSVAICFAAGFFTAKRFIKPTLETRTEIVEKIVERTVYVEKVTKAEKKNVTKKAITEWKPDGSIVKTESEVDLSQKDTTKKVAAESEKKSDIKVSHTEAKKDANVRVGIGTDVDADLFKAPKINEVYGAVKPLDIFPAWGQLGYDTVRKKVEVKAYLEWSF